MPYVKRGRRSTSRSRRSNNVSVRPKKPYISSFSRKRPAPSWKGRGDYKKTLKKLASFGVKAASAAISGLGTRSWDGAGVGWELGKKASKNIGLGDYSVGTMSKLRDNQLLNTTSRAPMMLNSTSSNSTGDVVLSHTEFCQNVVAINPLNSGSNFTLFENRSFEIQPGLTTMFPWLSQIAGNFTLYEFQGLIVEYRPTSGDSSITGTNALGKVILSTNYDSSEASFASTVEAENYDYSISGRPSDTLRHGIETSERQLATNMHYIRTGATTRDKLFTDIGRLQVMTEGIPVPPGSSAIIGELWVHYRIKLSRANLHASILGRNIQWASLYGKKNGTHIFGATATSLPGESFASKFTPSPYANYAAINSASTLSIRASSFANETAATMKIEFPQNIVYGIYQVNIYGRSSGNVTGITAGNFVNAIQLNQTQVFNDAASFNFSNNVDLATASFMVQINAPGLAVASFTVAFAALQNNAETTIFVTQLSSHVADALNPI